MKNVKNSKQLAKLQQMDVVKQHAIKRKIDKVVIELLNRFNATDDKNEHLTILNRMDEIVSAEIFYWSNVLNDLPQDCPPCMATKGEEATLQIMELTPIVASINELRKELIAD